MSEFFAKMSLSGAEKKIYYKRYNKYSKRYNKSCQRQKLPSYLHQNRKEQ